VSVDRGRKPCRFHLSISYTYTRIHDDNVSFRCTWVRRCVSTWTADRSQGKLVSAKRAWVVAMRAAHEAAHAQPQTGRHGGYADAAAQAAAASHALELSERRRQLDAEVTELNAAVLTLKAARRAVSERQRALTAFTTYLATDAAAEAAMAGGLQRAAPAGGWLKLPAHYDASEPSHTDWVLRALQQQAMERHGAGGGRRRASSSPYRRDSRGSGAGHHHRHRSADRRGSPLKNESSSPAKRGRTTPQRRAPSWSSPAEVGMRSRHSPSPATISRQYGPGNAAKGDGFMLASAVPFSPPTGDLLRRFVITRQVPLRPSAGRSRERRLSKLKWRFFLLAYNPR
jgi:hypothetical protein